MRAGVYVRVSTDRQDTANQLPALLELCKARGWEPDVREETASGAKARPVLDALCEDARRGRVPVLVVWALDRLGRDLWEILDRVRALGACNVRVVSLSEPWCDTAGPVRDLLLMLFAWVAAFERQRLRERTRAGVEKARAKGKTLGRPRADPAALCAARGDVLTGFRSVRQAAAERGVGEGTLRRFLKRRD